MKLIHKHCHWKETFCWCFSLICYCGHPSSRLKNRTASKNVPVAIIIFHLNREIAYFLLLSSVLLLSWSRSRARVLMAPALIGSGGPGYLTTTWSHSIFSSFYCLYLVLCHVISKMTFVYCSKPSFVSICMANHHSYVCKTCQKHSHILNNSKNFHVKRHKKRAFIIFTLIDLFKM